MTWEIMTRIEGSISDFSNPTPIRYANRDTGEIRVCESFSALVGGHDELADICRRVAKALGPDVLRRWADGESVDLATEVRERTAEPRSIALIAAERRRQIEAEGRTPDHDDGHAGGDLALAALCYTVPPDLRDTRPGAVPDVWPFEPSAWKPTPDDRLRELVKAGALIAAEIERLLRQGRG